MFFYVSHSRHSFPLDYARKMYTCISELDKAWPNYYYFDGYLAVINCIITCYTTVSPTASHPSSFPSFLSSPPHRSSPRY